MIHDDAVSLTLQFFENLKILNLVVTNLTKITCGSMFDHLPNLCSEEASRSSMLSNFYLDFFMIRFLKMNKSARKLLCRYILNL